MSHQLLTPPPMEQLRAPEVSGQKCGQPDSFHQLFRVTIDGFRHTVEVTEPRVSQITTPNVVVLPGYTQRIESGTGHELVQHLAHMLPQARVIGLATHGIGRYASAVTKDNYAAHSIARMPEHDSQILNWLCGNEPIVLAPVSLGGKRALHLIDYTARQPTPLNIQSMVALSPCILDPKRSKHLTANLVASLPREQFDMALRHASPQELLTMAGSLALLGIESLRQMPHELEALRLQRLDISGGTDLDLVERTVQAVTTEAVFGEYDPVYDRELWSSLPAQLHEIPRRRHGLFMEPQNAAAKIGRIISSML